MQHVVIEKEKMVAFAKQYDNIPIHTDEEYAKHTHFGKLIAPGVMSFMTVWTKPVFADDTLQGKAVITKLIPRNEKNGIVEITIHVYNQNDELVLVNVTEAIVKRKLV